MRIKRKINEVWGTDAVSAFDAKVNAIKRVIAILQDEQEKNYMDYSSLNKYLNSLESTDIEKHETTVRAIKYAENVDKIIYKLLKVIADEMDDFVTKR